MDQEQKIRYFFDTFVFGWMLPDVNKAMEAKAFLLAALGLLSYTEVLGGLRTGNLGIDGHSRQDFNEFLRYLGERHEELRSAQIDFYKWARCGLTHQYFTKGDSGVISDPDSPRAVVVVPGGRKVFNVHAYRNHFAEGAQRFYEDLLGGKDPGLVTTFNRAVKQAWKASP